MTTICRTSCAPLPWRSAPSRVSGMVEMGSSRLARRRGVEQRTKGEEALAFAGDPQKEICRSPPRARRGVFLQQRRRPGLECRAAAVAGSRGGGAGTLPARCGGARAVTHRSGMPARWQGGAPPTEPPGRNDSPGAEPRRGMGRQECVVGQRSKWCRPGCCWLRRPLPGALSRNNGRWRRGGARGRHAERRKEPKASTPGSGSTGAPVFQDSMNSPLIQVMDRKFGLRRGRARG